MSGEPGARDVGRPRVFSDEVIFEAVHAVIRRDGPTELTLERVAQEVGCTRQALVRRFGSKRNLLLAAVDAAKTKVVTDFGQHRESSDSPLDALRARMVRPPNSRPEAATSRQEQANLMAFMVWASTDAAFGQRFAELRRTAEGEVEALLSAAIERGELAQVDVVTMADALLSAASGESFAMQHDPTIDQQAMLSINFERIINPYRIHHCRETVHT